MSDADKILSVTFRLADRLDEDCVARLEDRLVDMLDADVVYSETQGYAFVTVDRALDGTRTAVAEMILRAVQGFGATVDHIDEDFVDLSEVAARAEVNHESARLWGMREDFPPPVAILSGGSRVWRWDAVHRWLVDRKPKRARSVVTYLTRSETAQLVSALDDLAPQPRVDSDAAMWMRQAFLQFEGTTPPIIIRFTSGEALRQWQAGEREDTSA